MQVLFYLKFILFFNYIIIIYSWIDSELDRIKVVHRNSD